MEDLRPDYKRIYSDIIDRKYPQKRIVCQSLLMKPNFSGLDVIRLNTMIFETENTDAYPLSQKYRSYDKYTMDKILEYQRKNNLNNTQVANHFKMSRNTVAKWKKMIKRW